MDDSRKIRAGSLGQRLKFLLKDSVLYGVASAVNKLLGLLILPILTRLFSTDEYGVIDTLAVMGGLFVTFIRLGQDSAVARFYYETEDPDKRRSIISQALIIELILCVLVCLPLLFTASLLTGQLLGDATYSNAWLVLVAGFPCVILVQFCQNILKWTYARAKFIFVSLGSVALIILLTLLFVFGMKVGVMGVFLAQSVGMASMAVVSCWFCRQYFVLPASFKQSRPMIHYGWPYMVVGMLAVSIPALDRLFITQFLSLHDMGLYAVGYKLAGGITLVIFAFQTAWGPFSLTLYKEADAVETYNTVLMFYTTIIGLLGFVLIACAKPLILLFASEQYSAGYIVVLPIVFGFIFESISWITGIGIDLSKKTYFTTYCYSIGLGISAISIFFLIRPFGILGVAYGVMVGRLCQSIFYTLFAYRSYAIRYRWKGSVLFLALTLLCCLAEQSIYLKALINPLLLQSSLFLFLVIWAWRISLSEDLRHKIKRLVWNKSLPV